MAGSIVRHILPLADDEAKTYVSGSGVYSPRALWWVNFIPVFLATYSSFLSRVLHRWALSLGRAFFHYLKPCRGIASTIL